jgi:hypothetical protein
MRAARLVLSSMGAAAILFVPSPVRATDEAPIDQAAVLGELDSYYGGERTAAYIVAGLGLASIGAGSALVTRSEAFARGLGWPLLGLGGLEVVGGVAYAFQVSAEVHHYQGALAQDAAAYRAEELVHIRGTRARFVYYRITEIALFALGAGFAIYGFASNHDAWKGVGIGVAGVALPIAIIDTFNNARAAGYEEQVQRFQPRVGLELGRRGDRPWGVSISGTF